MSCFSPPAPVSALAMLCYHVKKAGTGSVVLHQRRQLCLWARLHYKEQTTCDKHPFLPEPPLKTTEEKTELAYPFSNCLKSPVALPHLSAWAKCHQAPQGHEEDMSGSPTLSHKLSVMSRGEHNFAMTAARLAGAPDSVYAASSNWRIWSDKTCFPPCQRVFSVPWRKSGYQTAGAMWGLLSFPFSPLRCSVSSWAAGPEHANPEPVSQQDLCHKDWIILLAHTLWTVWQDKRNQSPAFISALWGQLPRCSSGDLTLWVPGPRALPGVGMRYINTQLCQAGSCRHMKLPRVPLAAIMHSFTNIQLLNSLSYSEAKML